MLYKVTSLFFDRKMPLFIAVAFLLSVSEVISQCPPSSGKTQDVYSNNCMGFYRYLAIYLMHNEKCYPNGSYFQGNNIRPTPLECVLHGATLTGGQWIGPNGTVPCPGNNSNVQCTVGSPGTNLSVHINYPSFLEQSGDGWYKCCLPTDCSNSNTNIIFANIFSKRRLIKHLSIIFICRICTNRVIYCCWSPF